MLKIKENKKKEIKIEEIVYNKEEDIQIKNINSEPEFEEIRVEDLEKAERIEISHKIKGVKRITRTAERDPKEAITKFDRHTFDAGFQSLQTSEISYQLLRDELIKAGLISDLVAEVNAGKEASIYIAHLRNAPLIIKSFRLQLTSHNRTGGNPQIRATAYAVREYYRLTKAFRGGMRVPTPAKQINNTILMTFIGTNWIPAPQLRAVKLMNPEEIFDEIIEQLWLMYNKAKLIHGDLSEYNILIHNNKPVIIDFPQAIDMSLLEMKFPDNLRRNLQVLQKDIQTVGKYFQKEYNLDYDYQEVYKYIIGKDIIQEEMENDLLEKRIELERKMQQQVQTINEDIIRSWNN